MENKNLAIFCCLYSIVFNLIIFFHTNNFWPFLVVAGLMVYALLNTMANRKLKTAFILGLNAILSVSVLVIMLDENFLVGFALFIGFVINEYLVWNLGNIILDLFPRNHKK